MSAHKRPTDNTLQNLLEIKVEKFLTPLENFIHKQTTASIFLALATLIALVLANSPWDSLARAVANVEIGVVFHRWHFLLTLKEWMGSGFMALFFFLIGLEMKREILAGKLQHPKQISLIIMAAIGGMVFPAVIYWGFNHGAVGQHGWAIPMATDTAFVIGILALLAKRVSYGISIFLIAMAIFDDIGAIVVVSLFYTHELQISSLVISASILLLLFFINISGVRSGWVYGLLGVILWGFIYNSGIHATLAGLLMAVVIPARTRLGETGFVEEVRVLLSIFETSQRTGIGMLAAPGQHSLAADIEDAVKDASTPLQRWETLLINPIGIVVLPLFALFHAGVPLSGHEIEVALSSRVTLGIMMGLAVGKPLGISLLVLAGLWLKIGKLPEGMRFTEVVAVGLLAGIGFTMSLFITVLSFEHHPELIDSAKVGILFASLISAIAASIWICLTTAQKSIKA